MTNVVRRVSVASRVLTVCKTELLCAIVVDLRLSSFWS
jgi:hypothetical protein